MNVFTRRLLSVLLMLALLGQPLLALTEEILPTIAEDPQAFASVEDDPDALAAQADESSGEVEKWVATSNVALKVRSGPGREYTSVDSIPQGMPIYIIELGPEWSKVRTSYTIGFVLSSYLTNISEYDVATGAVGDGASVPQEVEIEAFANADDFKYNYKAYAVKNAMFYAEPDEKSRFVTKAPIYQEVIVSLVMGDWCYAMYEKKIGYVRCSDLFKWDRIDPYAGDIPGCIVYPTLAFVGSTTDILDYATSVVGKGKSKILKTINPGAAICVEKPDAEGRYKTPYWRTTGFITEEDISHTMDVVPYEQAQPGDLISVMTTYYAVGIHTLNYQGRNWNIYLSTTMITGSILQPNETFNVNNCIGPYRQSTGYKRAPIASPRSAWGYGGGTCQVNTTLYNTIIQVPIYVNHRQVHANVGIKYIPKGFDAAVGGRDINMIFTNTLPYAIRLNFFMSDGVLTCCIFRES